MFLVGKGLWEVLVGSCRVLGLMGGILWCSTIYDSFIGFPSTDSFEWF